MTDSWTEHTLHVSLYICFLTVGILGQLSCGEAYASFWAHPTHTVPFPCCYFDGWKWDLIFPFVQHNQFGFKETGVHVRLTEDKSPPSTPGDNCFQHVLPVVPPLLTCQPSAIRYLPLWKVRPQVTLLLPSWALFGFFSDDIDFFYLQLWLVSLDTSASAIRSLSCVRCPFTFTLSQERALHSVQYL